MNLSPLQLRHYKLQKLLIEPVSSWKKKPGDDGEYPSSQGLQINAEVEVGKAKGNPNAFGIRLTISASPEKSQYPYKFELGVEGFVEMIGMKDSPDKRDIAAVNGVSLLYGVLRETFLALTYRFDHGPAMLPTLHFQALRNAESKSLAIQKRSKREAKPERSSTV